MKVLGIAMLGYLLGSFPSAVLAGRLVGIQDIRNHGSRNMGTFNTLRTAGKGAALFTLSLDLGKGILAAVWGRVFGVGLMAAYFALLGHIFPLYVGFRGGKGLAVYLGSLSILLPGVLPLAGISWAILYYGLSKGTALSSVLTFSLIIPLFMVVAPLPQAYPFFGILSGFTILLPHYQDLRKGI